jgi:hypothetical protein
MSELAGRGAAWTRDAESAARAISLRRPPSVARIEELDAS